MKSAILLVIGGLLLLLAFVDNSNKNDSNAAAATIRSFGGSSRDFPGTTGQDRISVYALGGIGAMFVIAGIVTLGGTKKQ